MIAEFVEEYVLLDTDVYSYLWKGHSFGERFRFAIERRRVCISFATVAELYKGAEKTGWGKLKSNRRHFEGIPDLRLVSPD